MEISEKIAEEKRTKILYCKKQIAKKDWEDNYMHSPMYMALSVPKEQGYWIAFSRVDNGKPLPMNIILLDDDEMRQFDNYKRSNNVLPEVCETIDNTGRQKLDNCQSIKDLKEVWSMFNTATKLFLKDYKNEKKIKFQTLKI